MMKAKLVDNLIQQIEKSEAPTELKKELSDQLLHLAQFETADFYLEEIYRYQRYLKWLLAFPFKKEVRDKLDLKEVKQVLDKHHYGLDFVKKRILEYLAVMKLKEEKKEKVRAPVILLTGLVGTGKTTFAYALAEALGRPIVRIPFGGLASVEDLRGRSHLALESQPGLIIQGLVKSQVKNPVILLDEIDRIEDRVRMAIMGVLVELLDPEQNNSFRDNFFDYPVDLSRVFFIATSNNTQNIATAVLDRLEVIEMPSYTDAEKVVIAGKFLLPRVVEENGLDENQIVVKDEVWPLIIRPIGYEGGVRTLKQIIEGMVRGLALRIVNGEKPPFILDKTNYKEFLPSYLT